jgi:hypothetical protein
MCRGLEEIVLIWKKSLPDKHSPVEIFEAKEGVSLENIYSLSQQKISPYGREKCNGIWSFVSF